jgi:hypothetical protein
MILPPRLSYHINAKRTYIGLPKSGLQIMAMPSALAVPPLNMVRIGPLMFVIKPALPSQRLETFWGRLKKWTALSNSLGTSTKKQGVFQIKIKEPHYI